MWDEEDSFYYDVLRLPDGIEMLDTGQSRAFSKQQLRAAPRTDGISGRQDFCKRIGFLPIAEESSKREPRFRIC
jgi:hypothetical protein